MRQMNFNFSIGDRLKQAGSFLVFIQSSDISLEPNY